MRSLLALSLVLGCASLASAGGVKGECEMRIDVDPVSRLISAEYETPRLCGSEVPRWILEDVEPDHLDMLVTNDAGVKPEPGYQGWHMQPVAPVGGPYNVQARAGVNNGRARFLLTINPDGSLIVVTQ